MARIPARTILLDLRIKNTVRDLDNLNYKMKKILMNKMVGTESKIATSLHHFVEACLQKNPFEWPTREEEAVLYKTRCHKLEVQDEAQQKIILDYEQV